MKTELSWLEIALLYLINAAIIVWAFIGGF